MNTVLISGASGNLGKRVQRLLDSSTDIIPISIQSNIEAQLSLHEERLRNPFTFIHLSWPISQSTYRNAKENLVALESSRLLFSRLFSLPIERVLGIGSILEDGRNPLVCDNSPPKPMCAYSIAKSRLCEWLFETSRVPVTWLRPAHVISAKDYSHKLIPMALANVGGVLPLKSPLDSYDFIHADDVAQAIKACLLTPSFSSSRSVVGCGRAIRVDSLCEALGVLETPKTSDEDPFHQETRPDHLREIGWRPKYVSLSELSDLILKEAHLLQR